MRTNSTRLIRIAGQASIGLASAAIAVTTFGAASASAATVTHPRGNSVAIGTIRHLPPTVTGTAALPGAFAPGGKGSPSNKTCDGFNSKIQAADNAYTAASGSGDVNAAGKAAKKENRVLGQASRAGCVVIYPN